MKLLILAILYTTYAGVNRLLITVGIMGVLHGTFVPPGTGKMRTCGPADRPTGKLRTKPADQVCSLPVSRSAGPRCLYVFLPCC